MHARRITTSTALREKRKEKKTAGDAAGDEVREEETREGEREKASEGSTCRRGSCRDDLSRISRAVAAASPRAAQPQHKPPYREPLPSPHIPLSSRSPVRLAASRFSSYGARGDTGGAHCVLKTSCRLRHLSSPRSSSFRALPPPPPLSVSFSLSPSYTNFLLVSLPLSSPKPRYRSLRTRCRSKGG